MLTEDDKRKATLTAGILAIICAALIALFAFS